MDAQINCRYMNGYKPCGKSAECSAQCPSLDLVTSRVLIVHLEAMGAVVRSTSLLPAIKRKFPRSHVTWVTKSPMDQILKGLKLVDRVLTTSAEDQLVLSSLEFDVGFVIDKSLVAVGLSKIPVVDQIFGFTADSRTGVIVPATRAADELWQLGLSDHLKFHVNRKTETQLVVEALELGPWKRDPYRLELLVSEQKELARRRSHWKREPADPVIGINTGCGPLMPAKKWTIEYHRELIRSLLASGHRNLVLLGGPEDHERNQKIGEGLAVIHSATQSGVRDGLISVGACDLLITGDSYGMHLGIALGRFVIAWFGPSCSHEIDLYDRGVVLKSDVPCSPCWKRSCDHSVMCYDRVSIQDVLNAVQEGFKWSQTQNQRDYQSQVSG